MTTLKQKTQTQLAHLFLGTSAWLVAYAETR